MAFLVYFASISGGIKVFLGLTCLAFVIAFVAFCAMKAEGKNWIKPKYILTLALISILLGLSCAMVPDSSDIYKIAGVVGQEKAIIDVSGSPTKVNHIEVTKP